MEVIEASDVLTFRLKTLLVDELFNNGWKLERGGPIKIWLVLTSEFKETCS